MKLWTAGTAAALATAFFISGSQFTPVAHAQGGGTWDRPDKFTRNYSWILDEEDPPAVMKLDGEKIIEGNMVTIANLLPGGDVTLTGSKIGNDFTGEIDMSSGGVVASGTLLVDTFKVTLSQTGILDGVLLKIANGSEVKLGQTSRITGMTETTISGSAVTQGVNSRIEATMGDLTINDGAKVKQGDGGLISATLSSSVSGGSVIISGNLTNVLQGDESRIIAQDDVSINGAIVEQGNDSSVRSQAGGITITGGGKIIQGLGNRATGFIPAAGRESGIYAGGALSLSGNSEIIQLAGGTINSATGYGITLNNSKITQGDDSRLTSGNGILALNGTSTVTQGGNSELVVTSITGGTIHQGSDSKIQGDSLNLSATNVNQQNNGLIVGNALTKITGGAVNQKDYGEIQGNPVELSGTTITQAKSGLINSTGTITINDSGIDQEYGWSRITSNGNITIANSQIKQSVNSGGYGANSPLPGDNAVLRSANGAINISGSQSEIRQGAGGEIYGRNEVMIGAGTKIFQGDNSAIATQAGNNITIGGTVVQENGGSIRTTGGGRLNLQTGADITQGNNGSIVNANSAGMNLTGVTVKQGFDSILQTTSGNLAIEGGRISQEGYGTLAAGPNGTITIKDNAKVNLGVRSKVRVRSSNAVTDDEKKAETVALSVTGNGSTLTLGGMSSIVSWVDGIGDQADLFHKIEIGAGAEISTSGMFTLNNDWLDLAAGAKLSSSDGMIRLTNGSKVYGNGEISSFGLSVTNGSRLSPGNEGIGTLTVCGPLTVTQSGVVEIRTNTNNANGYNVDSYIIVKDCIVYATHDIPELGIQQGDEIYREKGDVVIAGSLALSSFDRNKEYLIIKNEGTGEISGQFKVAAWNEAVSTIKDGDLWVSLQRKDPAGEENYFVTRGGTFNQKSAGRMLDSMINVGGEWDGILEDLWFLEDAQLKNTLDKLSGGVKANSLTLYRENPWRSAMNQYAWNTCGQVVLGGQNRFCPNTCQKSAVWATPYYTQTEYRSDGNAGAYSVDSMGFLTGINTQIDQKTVLGFFFGYGRPEMKQGWDSVDMDDITFGMTLGGMITPKVELKVAVAGGFQNYSMKRNLRNVPYGGMATSDFDGNTLFTSIEFARPMYFNPLILIRPLVALESESVWQDGFRERGSIYALQYDKAHNDRVFVRTGLSGEFGGGQMSLVGRAFYSYQFGGEAYSQGDARFVNSGNGFQPFRGIDLERSFVTLGAGGNYYLNPRKTQTVAANYDATISDKSTSHAVYVGFTQLF